MKKEVLAVVAVMALAGQPVHASGVADSVKGAASATKSAVVRVVSNIFGAVKTAATGTVQVVKDTATSLTK